MELWSGPVWHEHQELEFSGPGFQVEMTSPQAVHSQRHSKWMTRRRASSPWNDDDPELRDPPQLQVGYESNLFYPRAELWAEKNGESARKEESGKVVSQGQTSKNKTKSARPSPSTTSPVLRSGSGLPSQVQFTSHPRMRQLPQPTTTPYLSEEAQRQKELELFYRTYDPKEGIVTAIVLGGFFVFVSLLVLYKTKCKPMWKNRRKRLTNTPVTQSVVEGDSFGGGGGMNGSLSFPYPSNGDPGAPVIIEDETTFNCEEDFGFECIPLQPVCNDDYDDEDDIYFLDEYGNYVFPLSTPTIPGSCSCPSNEDLASNARRVSQVKWWSLFDTCNHFFSTVWTLNDSVEERGFQPDYEEAICPIPDSNLLTNHEVIFLLVWKKVLEMMKLWL